MLCPSSLQRSQASGGSCRRKLPFCTPSSIALLKLRISLSHCHSAKAFQRTSQDRRATSDIICSPCSPSGKPYLNPPRHGSIGPRREQTHLDIFRKPRHARNCRPRLGPGCSRMSASSVLGRFQHASSSSPHFQPPKEPVRPSRHSEPHLGQLQSNIRALELL